MRRVKVGLALVLAALAALFVSRRAARQSGAPVSSAREDESSHAPFAKLQRRRHASRRARPSWQLDSEQGWVMVSELGCV